jgi:DNA-binding PadR family transcriptional regulator
MTPVRNTADDSLPLKPATYHVLLALSQGELHGLGIADEVDWLTRGQIKLGPGTLYRSLKQMSEDGWIIEAETDEDDDPRRKYYEITALGRRLLRAESERFDHLVQVARERRVLSEGRS